ncbi:Gfo/Idh/MocA family oxidoreductase [Allokutzneria sp. NRRL B-24872]|uniref:Gfo/Idh/MocA family oxidoreductase n=1 Tax=Allokutzneria sp. NRRL B-24872 TaxID=1137961 RepID=UPI00143D57E6|nr:Gfo/Idh/MocA family oxidoreductase [Allokutzneria sp. NRRL B-24872]
MKVLVCGTTFGQSYLAAIAQLAGNFELAGVLGRGSERSVATAHRAGVPLYTAVDQLPDDIDLACVVVRSSSMGGPGSELARELLARGINVLQEQPVHHDDLAESLRVARRNNVTYRLGDLYAQLPAARRFVAAARELGRPLYVDAVCGVQVSFPLLHVIGDALGTVRPWSFTKLMDGEPFSVVGGQIGGVPVTLRVQNQINPDDPDNHMHVLHRITIGTDSGTLTLNDAHGPVSWTPRLHIPESVRTSFDFTAPDAAHLAEPCTTQLAGNPGSYKEFLTEELPAAIGRDLLSMVEGARPDQYHLTLCRMWQDLTSQLGYASLLTGLPQ